MLFVITVAVWFVIAIILTHNAKTNIGLVFICLHVLIFLASLKIVETFF